MRRGDELQEGRIKVIHTFGSTAKVALQFTPGAAPYTGIYGGSCAALCRISPARLGFDSFTPGMGIKARDRALPKGLAMRNAFACEATSVTLMQDMNCRAGAGVQ